MTDVYTASLQVHLRQMPPGQFQTLATQSGVGTFPQGTSTLSGAFCAVLPFVVLAGYAGGKLGGRLRNRSDP